mmetsp:Transcript_10845/g.25772  ORF Transcript_10845/g.25772 Transcript_10845/m.25772 type:complete len:413 (-) Transcript_10845:1616-2854(-)
MSGGSALRALRELCAARRTTAVMGGRRLPVGAEAVSGRMGMPPERGGEGAPSGREGGPLLGPPPSLLHGHVLHHAQPRERLVGACRELVVDARVAREGPYGLELPAQVGVPPARLELETKRLRRRQQQLRDPLRHDLVEGTDVGHALLDAVHLEGHKRELAQLLDGSRVLLLRAELHDLPDVQQLVKGLDLPPLLDAAGEGPNPVLGVAPAQDEVLHLLSGGRAAGLLVQEARDPLVDDGERGHGPPRLHVELDGLVELGRHLTLVRDLAQELLAGGRVWDKLGQRPAGRHERHVARQEEQLPQHHAARLQGGRLVVLPRGGRGRKHVVLEGGMRVVLHKRLRVVVQEGPKVHPPASGTGIRGAAGVGQVVVHQRSRDVDRVYPVSVSGRVLCEEGDGLAELQAQQEHHGVE